MSVHIPELGNEERSSMEYTEHDYTISDNLWGKMEMLLSGREGCKGARAVNNRRFINAIFWIFYTKSPWRHLPEHYGDWKNTHRRFSRWLAKGTWAQLFTQLADEPQIQRLEQLMQERIKSTRKQDTLT